MAGQEFAQPQRHVSQEVQTEEETQTYTPQEFSVDDLLNDIDSVLETNASEFVQSFVQKGGE